MRIGIIIQSSTGNTLYVAGQLKSGLEAKGHEVFLERVTAMNEDPRTREGKQLKDAPEIGTYDILIFGAPVWGFSLSSVMFEYLTQLPAMTERRTGCFATQFFPYAWMGGNHAIEQMKQICTNKGAEVYTTGVINWSGRGRENKVKKLVEEMGSF